MSELTECEGECGERWGCRGAVRRVHVYDGAFDWGPFDYCDAAIKEHLSKGYELVDPKGEDS